MTDEDGRVRRGQESREARRAQIKGSALEVFSARGYHQTSVSDLVEAAGVARGTFYLYFDSKDAIFLELLDDLLVQLRGAIVGIDTRPGAESMEVQLVQIVALILRALVENRPLTRIVFREAIGLHADVDRRVRLFEDELHTFVAASLTLGATLGTIRAIDPAVGASCIVGSLREIAHRNVVGSDDPIAVEPIAHALVDYHLRGLSSPNA
ncbi:MAG: TetR/AcrR family transcriptional regulator [Myxococcota bacterium]